MDAQQAAAARREALGIVVVDHSVIEQLRADAAPVVETVASPDQAHQRNDRRRFLDDVGVVEVPAAELAELHQQAAIPAQVEARRRGEQAKDRIHSAITAQAITPAEGRAWAAVLAADPDSITELDRFPAGRVAHIVPTEMIGRSDHDPDESAGDAIYRATFGAHR